MVWKLCEIKYFSLHMKTRRYGGMCFAAIICPSFKHEYKLHSLNYIVLFHIIPQGKAVSFK